jgi:hypothetical protein
MVARKLESKIRDQIASTSSANLRLGTYGSQAGSSATTGLFADMSGIGALGRPGALSILESTSVTANSAAFSFHNFGQKH